MSEIKLCYTDSYGKLIFKAGNKLYMGCISDSAIAYRIAEQARHKPGAAFNSAKNYTTFQELPK